MVKLKQFMTDKDGCAIDKFNQFVEENPSIEIMDIFKYMLHNKPYLMVEYLELEILDENQVEEEPTIKAPKSFEVGDVVKFVDTSALIDEYASATYGVIYSIGHMDYLVYLPEFEDTQYATHRRMVKCTEEDLGQFTVAQYNEILKFKEKLTK